MKTMYGNQNVKKYIERMIAKKSIPNSLLFAGPDGVGKGIFAEWLAKELVGDTKHPDVHIYKPEGKIGMHSIQSLRQLSEEVYMAPFRGPWKIFIIHDADRMLSYSANALLKTFEEPAPDSIIILLTSTPFSLLPTIISRCSTIHFQFVGIDEIANFLHTERAIDKEKAQEIAIRAQGSIGNATRLLEAGGSEIREMVLQVLSRGRFSSYKELSEAVEAIWSKVEDSKKIVEEQEREGKCGFEGLTAVQKESVEKEVEGVMTIRLMKEAQALFDVILGWSRDIHLLMVNGNRHLLMHPEFEHAMEQALQRGEIKPLEEIQKFVADARLSLERSTPFVNCLETLFLRLGLL